jgi:clan AA aspartic protease (TIGR02281 family)
MNRSRSSRIEGRRSYGGVLAVPCLFNGTFRYWMLVDTGAALTLLSQQAAEEMGLDLSRAVRQEHIASIHRTVPVPVLLLESLQVGAHRVSDMEVVVLPLPPELRIDGLLGINFLERFRPTFEFDRGTLVLR